MNAQPLVSICIPAYNNRDFVAAALESVLTQTYVNLEIILIDDHSTDDTITIASRFPDSRIILTQNAENIGIGHNWNKALSFATGKYIKVMGADDLLYPDCVETQVNWLEDPANSKASLAVCNSDVINASGKIVLKRHLRSHSGPIDGRRLIRSCVRLGANLIGEPVAGLFKREVLAKSVKFDASNPYMIDLIFWAEVLKHGHAILDSRRLAAFRISSNSVSTKLGMKHAAYTRNFIRRMSADPYYQVGNLDVLCGSVFALPRCLLRNWLMKRWANQNGI
jgi:glycosyltransferase involved in cell wall biosynthesis